MPRRNTPRHFREDALVRIRQSGCGRCTGVESVPRSERSAGARRRRLADPCERIGRELADERCPASLQIRRDEEMQAVTHDGTTDCRTVLQEFEVRNTRAARVRANETGALRRGE